MADGSAARGGVRHGEPAGSRVHRAKRHVATDSLLLTAREAREGIDRIRRKTYIYCNDPEPTTFTPFYEKLKSQPGWTVRTLPCSHFVQMDMPEELTALLRAAA